MAKKILVIEDEKQLCRNISIFLKAENFNIAIAGNGKEGIELTKTFEPDLIICDIMMPKMDGYGVKTELNKSNKTIPFIFLTAKVDRNDLRKGMELGADDYLFKPFTNDELIKAVNTQLDKFDNIKSEIINKKNQNDVGNQQKQYKADDNIFLKMYNSSLPTKVDKIKYIISANQYTNVVLESNKTVLIRRTINTWEQVLPENIFIRIHRKTIINIHYINKIERCHGGNYRIILKDTADFFNISRKYLKAIKSTLLQ